MQLSVKKLLYFREVIVEVNDLCSLGNCRETLVPILDPANLETTGGQYSMLALADSGSSWQPADREIHTMWFKMINEENVALVHLDVAQGMGTVIELKVLDDNFLQLYMVSGLKIEYKKK